MIYYFFKKVFSFCFVYILNLKFLTMQFLTYIIISGRLMHIVI